MNKSLLIIASIFLLFSYSAQAASGTNPNGQPFQAIQENADAIAANKAAIDNIGGNYVRTVVVSPVLVGGVPDPVASGTALLAALDGIIGASDADPWLIKIEPGIYDLGTDTLSMKPYVHIEGSGEEVVTTITSASETGTVVFDGVANPGGLNNIMVSHVQILNTSSGSLSLGDRCR